ncbi:hypothetical protein GCM10023320_76600 [Pseudonocardia adelaidensis]|uniref:Integrase-like protein n=2 Tax=Pseudonocardia adelaidensis TaxID=648754 RepID=A0ABP9P3G8_9PSEU
MGTTSTRLLVADRHAEPVGRIRERHPGDDRIHPVFGQCGGVVPVQVPGRRVEQSIRPTFSAYIPRVSRVVSSGTRRVYAPYWSRVQEKWGDRPIDEPSPLEIRELAEAVRGDVVTRRNARGGRSAVEHLIAALRCLYHHAVSDGLISEAANPARKVAKPRRLPSTRRALPDARLAEINEVAASTGNDHALDALLLRLHIETACRRGEPHLDRKDVAWQRTGACSERRERSVCSSPAATAAWCRRTVGGLPGQARLTTTT